MRHPASTHGCAWAHCAAQIWGRPAEYLTATYTTEKGEQKQSLLLLSGWWGIARHIHYVPELSAAFLWSCGGLFNMTIMPLTYFLFLLPLLIDRAFRDDERGPLKYGKFWDEYRRHVPYKIVPGLL